ncbi:MAG: hypothetical protein RR910_03025 [Acidaminococcaceae bacterium]
MLESELVGQIEKYLNKYQIRYAKEVRMGIGVPDVSINIGASKSMAVISDYYLLSIVEYLNNNKRTTVNEISDHFGYDKVKFTNYLNKLQNDKVVLQNDNRICIRRKIFGLNLGKTISIEAKLKDWKSGILQAERYLMFSDYSYLALPKDRIKNVDLEYINQSGIGLLSVDASSIEEIIKPRLSTECEYKQKYIITSAIIVNDVTMYKRRIDGIFSNLRV